MDKKLIGFLIKKGNKAAATAIYNKICTKISYTLPFLPPTYFFSVIFSKLNTNIEVKKISFRKRVHFIPTPIRINRKIFIVFMWIKQVIARNTQKVSFSDKFYSELIAVIFSEKSSALIKLKIENGLKAYNYKSKAHFRWN